MTKLDGWSGDSHGSPIRRIRIPRSFSRNPHCCAVRTISYDIGVMSDMPAISRLPVLAEAPLRPHLTSGVG